MVNSRKQTNRVSSNNNNININNIKQNKNHSVHLLSTSKAN
jgi:hypothetical protein